MALSTACHPFVLLRFFSMTIAALIFGVLTSNTPIVQAQTPSAPAPTLNDAILYLSQREGSWKSYIMNSDGTNQRLVTPEMEVMTAYEALFSPDRMQVAFISHVNDIGHENIYVVNSDGTQLTELLDHTSGDLYITWLPNGQQIGFVSDREEGRNIYVINPDGSGLTRLTPNDGTFNDEPLWSPNGEKIAFFSNKDGSRNLYIMDADGSDVKQVTADESISADFAWSPDSEAIVFTSTRDGYQNLYRLTFDGDVVDQLTYGKENSRPAWSPDGEKIAFISARNGRANLYTMNLDGTGPMQITENDRLKLSCPQWMADSQKIVFVGAPIGENTSFGLFNIYVVNRDGSGLLVLTGDDTHDRLSHCGRLFG